jgi:hypothetical protein
MYTKQSLAVLQKALEKLSEGFADLPPFKLDMPEGTEEILYR